MFSVVYLMQSFFCLVDSVVYSFTHHTAPLSKNEYGIGFNEISAKVCRA